MVGMTLYGMYGDYACSCGCGKPLAGTVVVFSEDWDDEGREWRTFTPDCAHKAILKCGTYDKVYETYSAAEPIK